MEKRKIALISDWYPPKVGGIEYSMHALAKTLAMHGNDVSVITRSYPNFPEHCIIDGISIIRIQSKPFPGQSRFLMPNAYKQLYYLLKKGNYKVVNCHGLDSPLGISALLASRRLKIPVVITNHSLVGHAIYGPFLYSLGKLFLRYADAIIAVSSAVEKDSKVMTEKPIYRIFNGINSGEIATKVPFPFDTEGKIIVITVARMTKKKGVQNILYIASDLLKKYKNLIFVMVGEGPLKRRLEKMVKEQGLSENFYFTGNVSRDKVFGYLEQADIFALPSMDEAFGISILEAISRNVPVLAMNHSGVSDILENGVSGYLANNLTEFESYLRILIENPSLRTSLAEKASQKLPNFDWDRIYEQTNQVYSKVIYEKYYNNN
jgi:1,2-diacylglycerol 3-alpha-glucosyltransferase